MWAKDPCKKCLVKPCCNTYCDKKVEFNKTTYFGESLLENKIASWILFILSLMILIVTVIVFGEDLIR